MMNLTVVRKWISEKSTIGELLIDGKKYCFTLELPWKNNEKGVSCIPEGEYKVIVDWSNSKKTHLPHVLDVPNRDGIRIHIGNFPKDIQGCILVGERKGEDVVWNSGKVFGPLFDRLRAAREAKLVIKKEADNGGNS
jgi:hypothetical protein